MTSDGIEDADWDRVHELAAEIVNCTAAENESAEARACALLLELLDQLDERYGPKPSLLATRADYVESSGARERLLRSAYTEAERIADNKNRELIAHSLAQFYIEDARDLDEGATWLAIWRDQLGTEPDQPACDEIARLETILLKGGE